MKFKTGDLVRILDGEKTPEVAWLKPGMVGEVTEYVGNFFCRIDGAYHDYFGVCIGAKEVEGPDVLMELIPGGSESRQRGSWDVLPWSPYRVNEEAVARAVSEATARLRLAVKW